MSEQVLGFGHAGVSHTTMNGDGMVLATGVDRLALMPTEYDARGRSIRVPDSVWEGVNGRCRADAGQPASHAWTLLGAAYARGLVDLPRALPEGVDTTSRGSRSLRLPTWVWDGVKVRYAADGPSAWNPWTLLGAAYAARDLDLPFMALIYPA